MDLGDQIDASLNVDDIDHNYGLAATNVNGGVKVDGNAMPPSSEPPAQTLTPSQALSQFFGADGAPPVTTGGSTNLPGAGPISVPGVAAATVTPSGVTPPAVHVASTGGTHHVAPGGSVGADLVSAIKGQSLDPNAAQTQTANGAGVG